MAFCHLPSVLGSKYPCTPAGGVQAYPGFCNYKLKVEGTGRIKVQPDMAVVILGVVTEHRQLQAAQEENTARMTAVLRALKEMGIPDQDIQTRSYDISPQYDFIEGRQVFRGYRVVHMLAVTVRDMRRIGELIDTAVAKGANQVDSVRFSVSNPSAFYRQALNAAVDDALAKARTLERKLNIRVSRVPVQIVEVSYEQEGPIQPLMYQAAMAGTPIQAGVAEITARIEAVFIG